jgi:enoyl-CoA hydratase/carnithine racemase
MKYKRISIEDQGNTTIITMISPEKRNVLAVETMNEMIDTLQSIAESDALGVIIAAEGPVFSAGHNFADMRHASEQDARELFDLCTRMMMLIQSIPQVVIARVHALATAAGCQLVSMCDMAVAAESATFAAPGGKGGLFCHTPMVGIARAVGRKRGLEMALLGDAIDAQTAAEWGLVNRVVADDKLIDETNELMRRATRGSATSKAAGKRAYYTQIDMPQADAYEYASGVMAQGTAARDGQEGIAAFVEKRAAKFGPRE